MAATGFTPIQLYRTSTASAVPLNTNLADGELAINLTDEKLYFKNAAGTVKLLAANLTPVANGGTGVTTSTGTGSVVLSTSPTLVTPALGTPSSGTLTNATGLPISTGVSGLGTGVATALAVNVGTAGAPVVNGGVLGTPSSGTLTNATGLPISTGVSGLGTGVATFLATPNSANLASAVTDETGTGALVFAESPALAGTPTAPTAANGTNTTQIATTAYVVNQIGAIAAGVSSFSGGTTGLTPAAATSGAVTLAGTLAVANGGTGITSFGAGVATFLGTPSSFNLAAAVTGETGSGALVFGTSPSLTNPALSGETFSTSPAVTAGVNGQGQGALLSDYNVITTTALNPSGVTLPTATAGRRIVIVNKGSATVNVYPATGATIDALSANAAISLAVGGVMEFNASSATQWYSSYNLYTSATVSSGVTSFSAGTTGLTPSTTTTGAITLAGTLAVANGGTGVTTSTGSGSNVLSTSPTLTTPNLGTPSAATLTNATGLPIVAGTTGTLSVARGGTGATTLTANNVILGNGTSAVQVVAPGTSGNVLTSNGTTWVSAAAGGGAPSFITMVGAGDNGVPSLQNAPANFGII